VKVEKTAGTAQVKPASAAFTDEPPVTPAKLQGLDLGPACGQCGGMMQRTGSCYVLAGELLVHIDGIDHPLGPGGVAVASRGVPHAFLVTSPTARILTLQTPGSAEPFYRGASEPAGEHDTGAEGPVDFERVRASAERSGGMQVLGPPPFAELAAAPAS